MSRQSRGAWTVLGVLLLAATGVFLAKRGRTDFEAGQRPGSPTADGRGADTTASAGLPAAPASSGGTSAPSDSAGAAMPHVEPASKAIAPAATLKAAEVDPPTERMLVLDDALAGGCALEVLLDETRFSELFDTFAADEASLADSRDTRDALVAAHREAAQQAGDALTVAAVACGRQLCALELHLPRDTANEAIREAILQRLLGESVTAAASVRPVAQPGGPRVIRQIVSMSPDINRLDHRGRCQP